MRVWEIHDSYGLDHLKAVERPKPSPAKGEVLLAMKQRAEHLMGEVPLAGALPTTQHDCRKGVAPGKLDERRHPVKQPRELRIYAAADDAAKVLAIPAPVGRCRRYGKSQIAVVIACM